MKRTPENIPASDYLQQRWVEEVTDEHQHNEESAANTARMQTRAITPTPAPWPAMDDKKSDTAFFFSDPKFVNGFFSNVYLRKLGKESIGIHCEPENFLKLLKEALDATPGCSELFAYFEDTSRTYEMPPDFETSVTSLLSSESSITKLKVHTFSHHRLLYALINAAESVSSIKSFEAIWLSDNEDTPAELPARLAACTKLTRLEVDFNNDEIPLENALDRWALVLDSNPNLSSLRVQSELDGEAPAKKFCQALAGNHSVTDLNIDLPRIDDNAAESICQALAANSSVRKLKLALGYVSGKEIARILRHCMQLEALKWYMPEIVDACNEDEISDEVAVDGQCGILPVLCALNVNVKLHEFRLGGYERHEQGRHKNWTALDVYGQIMKYARDRNSLMREPAADAGVWISWMTNFQQMNKASLPTIDSAGTLIEGGSIPFIPAEIGIQIAQALALMLSPTEAARIMRVLRMGEIRQIEGDLAQQ